MADQIWVELVGDMIVARVRGVPDEQLGGLDLKRAIVVPNSKLAYMARLAFGHGNHRVFYNDIMAAIHWLGQPSPAAGA